jgi:hypothetical protein
MATNGTLFQRICSVITLAGFASSVVVNAASQFLETDVSRQRLPSLAGWAAPLSFMAFGLLLAATVVWAVAWVGSHIWGARMSAPSYSLPFQLHDIEHAIDQGLKETFILKGPPIKSVTTSLSQGEMTYLHDDVKYEGKLTVTVTPKKQ